MRTELQTQEIFATDRGWKFRMLSAQNSPITQEMGFAAENGDQYPGALAFHKKRRVVMSTAVVFQAVYPIGDTDTNALPVQDLGTAITYYTDVLGFTLVTQDEHKAVLKRDTVQIGLAPNGQDPEQASCYFAVSSVEALRAELEGKPIALSPSRLDDHGGKKYQVFFGKEPFGVCFCFGQPAQP